MIFLQHKACGIISGMVTVNAQRESRLCFRQALFSGIFIYSNFLLLFPCLDYLVSKESVASQSYFYFAKTVFLKLTEEQMI